VPINSPIDAYKRDVATGAWTGNTGVCLRLKGRDDMTRSNKLLMSIGVVAVAGFSLMGPAAQAQSDNWNALYDRIIRIEHQIKSIKGGGGAAGASQAGDQSYRLAAIEDQLRRLLGSVDQMRSQMRDMQGRIKRLEQRKSSASGQTRVTQEVTPSDTLPSYGTSTFQPSTSTSTFQPPASTSTFEAYTDDNSDLDLSVLPETSETQSGGLSDTTQFQNAPQSQVLGQLIIGNDGALPGNGQDEVNSLLPGQVDSAALDNPTPSTGSGGTGSGGAGGSGYDLYERSYKNLLNRRFGQAEAGFKTFINKNPKHPSVSKARYWLGETFYAQGQYKQAAQSFLTGYRSHPKGARAPESLLKLGMSLNKLGQKKQACGAYAEVSRSYPSAKKTAKLAVRESKRAGC